MSVPNHAQHTATLKAQLIQQLPSLVTHLFPDRNIQPMAHEYRIGTNGSVSISHEGEFFDHEAVVGGDTFTMIQHVLKIDFKGALAWAQGFVGNAPLPLVPPTENQQKKHDERAVQQREKALAMLKRATPIQGTLAEVYLREKRDITIEQLPASLGFIAHAYNFTTGASHPAMIALMQDVDGKTIAAHLTFLDPATGDKLKNDGAKPRLIFGACSGGAIRLTEATDRLALCEGIEDGLSIMQCTDWPVWACAGTSGMRSVQIPSHVREIMICADNDDAGKQAADFLSKRLVSEDKTVRIALPPAGYKDFNQSLCKRGSHV